MCAVLVVLSSPNNSNDEMRRFAGGGRGTVVVAVGAGHGVESDVRVGMFAKGPSEGRLNMQGAARRCKRSKISPHLLHRRSEVRGNSQRECVSKVGRMVVAWRGPEAIDRVVPAIMFTDVVASETHPPLPTNPTKMCALPISILRVCLR